MAYSELGIINLALGRIGVKAITADDWATPSSTQAVKVAAVWEYIRDEVLEAADWKFAKKRSRLALLEETPASDFNYAYRLPQDFLRLASIYPNSYDYQFGAMNVMLGDYPDFDPTASYTTSDYVRIGKYAKFDLGAGRHLFISAPYKLKDGHLLEVHLESNTSDNLSVVKDDYLITVKLANTTPANNYGSLIQGAIRALGTVGGVDVSELVVTENDAYAADRPTTGIDTPNIKLADGDNVWQCKSAVTGSAQNTSKFPQDTTYWVQYAGNLVRCLLSNYSLGFVMTYIARVTDATVYPPSFINALACRLAAELAIPLAESRQKEADMLTAYTRALTVAMEIDNSMDYMETPNSWDER